jgi:hypothetical protein
MEELSTQLQLETSKGLMQSRHTETNRGVLQGDSLPLLVSCIALISVTHELNRSKYG